MVKRFTETISPALFIIHYFKCMEIKTFVHESLVCISMISAGITKRMQQAEHEHIQIREPGWFRK